MERRGFIQGIAALVGLGALAGRDAFAQSMDKKAVEDMQ